MVFLDTFVRTQLILCIVYVKETLEIDASHFIRSLFCLRSSYFDYKIDIIRTSICNDAFYRNNYPSPPQTFYRLGPITATTPIFSSFAGASAGASNTFSQFMTTRGPPTPQFTTQQTRFTNNNQGGLFSTILNNFQDTTLRQPFVLSTTTSPEFNPSGNEAYYDDDEPYAAPRQKIPTSTERDVEPLNFAAELLPSEKLVAKSHVNCALEKSKNNV